MKLDASTRAALDVLHAAGFTTTVVKLERVYHVAAIDPSGERWRVSGDDAYQVLCELAAQVDLDLADT
jgi:hypothetical protein